MHSARMMRYFLVGAVVALASCATNRVERIGQDTYLITIGTPLEQNRTPAELALSASRMSEVRREATRRSQEYCARQRRRPVELDSMMSVQGRSDPAEVIDISDEKWVGIQTLTFRCE